MATIYVVQEMPNHDLAPAMKFGEMKILLPPYTQIAFSTTPTIRTLRHKLRNFSDEDFLLLAGDRREHLYLPVKIDVTQKGESDE